MKPERFKLLPDENSGILLRLIRLTAVVRANEARHDLQRASDRLIQSPEMLFLISRRVCSSLKEVILSRKAQPAETEVKSHLNLNFDNF